jgi:hypothetical protein
MNRNHPSKRRSRRGIRIGTLVPRRSSVTLSRPLAGILGLAVLFQLFAPLGAAATVQRTVFVEEFGYVS